MADAPLIQAGTFKKTAVVESVAFPKTYPPGVIPIVVVTPYWRRSANEIGHIDTVTQVSEDGFTVTSLNVSAAGPPVEFFVNWVAMPRS